VFDLDGVVYLGQTGIPGAALAFRTLESAGFHLLFATNNASVTQASVVERVQRLTGYDALPSAVVTCGMAAAHYMSGKYERVLVIGEPGLTQTLEAAGIAVVDADSEPDAVVVGVDFDFTYKKLDDAARAIRSGAAFIATNTDPTFPHATGQAPGAGPLVAAVETASGVTPVVCGKPHQPMIDILNSLIGGGEVWMVGDRPETDIATAARAGWNSILTLTGVVSSADDIGDRQAPDHIVASIAEVPAVVFGPH
jgi:HAD superfamily hydrolase (TIGR01450 family)